MVDKLVFVDYYVFRVATAIWITRIVGQSLAQCLYHAHVVYEKPVALPLGDAVRASYGLHEVVRLQGLVEVHY